MPAASQRSAFHRVLFAATALLAGSTSAWAVPATGGCSDVNAGFFNVTNSTTPNFQAEISGFHVGDRVEFTVTGNASGQSHFELLNGPRNTVLLNLALSTTPNTGSYTVTGANGDLALATFFVINMTGSTEITIAATCVGGAPPAGKDASQAVTKSFLLSRINGILLNDPGSTSLLNRSTGQSGPMSTANLGSATNVASSGTVFGGAMGLGAGFGNRTDGISTDRLAIGSSRFGDDDADSAGAQNIQFSGSLSKMRREAAQAQRSKDRMALGAGDGGSLPLAYATTSPWDIWVEGRYSAFNDDAGNLDRDGHVGVLYVGGDYRITNNMIVGALVQFDWAKDDSGVLASKVDGNGWMIGPYLSAQIHENIYFDLRAAWGRSTNDLDLAGVTGGFDTSRWLVKGALAGNWYHDAWRITPSAELAYVDRKRRRLHQLGRDARARARRLARPAAVRP